MKTDAFSTELNRIDCIKSFDRETWDQLSKICKPLIRKLTMNIDSRRLNLTPDLVEDYFWDKFLYIYHKYSDSLDFEHLKATMLTALKKYSYRLMRDCYTQQSEFYQSKVSFDILFDDNKGDIIDEEEGDGKSVLWNRLIEYLKNNLSDDEFLIWEILFNPPPFIKERMGDSKGKLSILHLIDFFEFPRNKKSYTYFNTMRNNVKNTLKKASIDLGKRIPESMLASNLSE